MMHALKHADLNRIAVDTNRFLGRVLLIGREHALLPAGLEDALFAFLRAHTLSHARRYRPGLGTARDTMEAGLRQGFSCLEEGLRSGTDGDVERAIERLAQGDFEALRRAGWERLWSCLDQMRHGAQEVLRSPSLPILEEWRVDLEQWATIIPETWTAQSEAGATVPVEPTEEYLEYQAVSNRAQFLDSLPSASRRRLLDRWPPNAEYSRFVRHLIAALALGCPELPLGRADIKRFTQDCFTQAGMKPEVRRTVLEQLQQHLGASGSAADSPDPDSSAAGSTANAPDPISTTTTISDDVAGEIARLEATDVEDRRALFALPRRLPGVVGSHDN